MKVEYLIVKEDNQQCKTAASFVSFLKTNDELRIGLKEIILNRFTVQYKLKTDKISSANSNGRYFILELTRKKASGQKKLEELEKFGELCKLLRGMFISSDFNFNLIVLSDSISAFYSEQAYPLLNNIENLMRKLIFKFMFMKIGANWLKDATPKEFQEKIKAKGEKNNVKNLIQESLYEADFIVLIDFLFKPYATLSQEKLIEKIRNAKQVKELILKELKEIVPKSNWDRYFSKFVEIEKLNSKWGELYELRNKVAHNKPIVKSDFDRIETLTTELGKKLTEAIDKIDEIKINEQEKQEVKESVIAEVLSPVNPLDFNSYWSNYVNKNLGMASFWTESFNDPKTIIGATASIMSKNAKYFPNTLMAVNQADQFYNNVINPQGTPYTDAEERPFVSHETTDKLEDPK